MTIDEMEHVVNRYASDLHVLRIDLVTGKTVVAILVLTIDYEELRKFNLWRFIRITDILKWKNSEDISLTEVLDGEVVKEISTLI